MPFPLEWQGISCIGFLGGSDMVKAQMTNPPYQTQESLADQIVTVLGPDGKV